MKFKKCIVVTLALISVLVASCLSAFAASDTFDRNKVIESIKSNDKVKDVTNGKNYFVVVLQGSSDFFVDLYVTGSQYLVFNNSIDIPNSDCQLYRFYLNDDSTIEFSEKVVTFSDFSVTVTNSNDFSDGSLLLSSYDIKNTDGTIFFDNPTLLKRLLNPVQEQVGEKVVADLGTLTVCGIGCLALLIGLSLFPKVLYKFL